MLLVDQTWGKPAEVADALGVILLTWNQAFYRYGQPDFDRLEEFLRIRQEEIARYQGSALLRLSEDEIEDTVSLFDQLLDTTSIRIAKTDKVRRSPVSAAKALHALAPRAFPIWDDSIRTELGYGGNSSTADKYVRFMRSCRGAFLELSHEQSLAELEVELSKFGRFPKTILKLLDEYFYSKYTKRWV